MAWGNARVLLHRVEPDALCRSYLYNVVVEAEVSHS